MSWARNLPEKRASGPAIALDESFRERGLGKVLKGLKGSIDETNKEAKDLLAFVRSRYHFKALGDNENWRQTKIRNIVYLNDCILRNQIAYLLLDMKDHLGILRGHGDFPYDSRKMALNRNLETISHNRKNKGDGCDCLPRSDKKGNAAPYWRIAAHPKLSHIVTYDWTLRQRTKRGYLGRRPLLCRVRNGGNLDRGHERADLGRGRGKEVAGRKRCLREASLKRGFANLPATSLALLCIEISESTPSRNFPPKRNSPSRGIRTAAEIFIRSVRPREFRVMARLRSVAKSRRRGGLRKLHGRDF